MDDKYFVPDIEDIRVGYEFELIKYSSNNYGLNKSECSWTKHTLKKEDIFSSGYKEDSFLETCISYLNSKHLRVPYLTKEQIEAEGWREVSKFRYEKINSNITIYYGNDHYLWIMHPATTILGEKYLANSFKGEIKSINEFRYICKLLKI